MSMVNRKHKHILENAEKLRELHENVKRTFAAMPRGIIKGPHHLRSKEWKQACDKFHLSWPLWAFPGGISNLRKLKNPDDHAIIEDAILFLEADPIFFRSGYIKKEILRALKKSHLTNKESERLQTVIIIMVDKCNREEFRDYCKLARVIGTSTLKEKLRDRLSNQDNNIQKRAKWVLEAIANKPT